MKGDTQIEGMRLYRIERIKKLLKADFALVVKEIKPHRPILGDLHSANLLLNINCNWHYDDDLVNSLKDEEIEKMIKILLHYEKIRFAGSVSAIPNLLRKLKRRNYKNLKGIVDWVIEFNNGSNPWIPTGYFKDQNLTTSEYMIKTLN
jgi:hypothetical protein